jgi:phage gp36-like protein
MLPASYATVENVYERYPPIGSVTAISSAQIAAAIGAEQARIDGRLGSRYATPFRPLPPVIEMIAGDLATLRIVGTRVLLVSQSKPDPSWTEAWRHSLDLLDQLAAGKVDLVSGSGTILPQAGPSVGELWSNTMTTTPAFVGQDWFDIDPHHPRYWSS